MKKLMIAAAIVCAAAMSQAASVTWKSTAYTALDKCTGTLGKGDLRMIVYEFSAADWSADYADGAKLFALWKAGDEDLQKGYVGQSTPGNTYTKASVTGGTGWTDKQDVYAAILYLHDDTKAFTADKVDYYMSNYATAKAADAGATVSDLGTTIGGTGGSSATSWTAAAVPEPTSGLLLLLGVAGLALKRKRA